MLTVTENDISRGRAVVTVVTKTNDPAVARQELYRNLLATSDINGSYYKSVISWFDEWRDQPIVVSNGDYKDVWTWFSTDE